MPNVHSPEELSDGYYDSLARGKIFNDYEPIIISGRMHETIKISTDRTIIKLVDKDQGYLMSCICGRMMTYHEKEYFEIQWTYSRTPGAGYLTYLFELLIYDMNLIILSDSNHTSPGSKEFWQSLIRKLRFKIYRYDITSNYKRKASSFREDEIWGLTKSEKEKIDAKLNYFDSLGFDINTIIQEPYPIVEDDVNSVDEISSELLDQYNEQVDENDPLIIKFEEFKVKYREKMKSKENVRLIAQRSTL